MNSFSSNGRATVASGPESANGSKLIITPCFRSGSLFDVVKCGSQALSVFILPGETAGKKCSISAPDCDHCNDS